MQSLDACLCAAEPIGRSDPVASIIDELERIVGLIYRPGLAVTGTIARTDSDAGDPMDHLGRCVGAAHGLFVQRRLPYSMLAEELMQVARRHWWDGSRGAFAVTGKEPLDGFLENCEAARVLCRLAALHADTEYPRGRARCHRRRLRWRRRTYSGRAGIHARLLRPRGRSLWPGSHRVQSADVNRCREVDGAVDGARVSSIPG